MEAEGKAAAEVETPVVDTADPTEAPAEPQAPSPEPEFVIKAELQTELNSLRAELKTARDEGNESGRRAQRAADTHASRLEKRIERLAGLLDVVATRGMDESEAQAWKLRQELEKEREARSTGDSEVQRQRQEDDWRTYSSAVLAEEQIAADNPTLKEAWGRYSAGAKDPSDWKAALGRAVAEVRKAELKDAQAKAKEAEGKAREDERAKIRNERRSSAGPVDQGAPGGSGAKKVADMSEEEFTAYKAQRDDERVRRRMAQIR